MSINQGLARILHEAAFGGADYGPTHGTLSDELIKVHEKEAIAPPLPPVELGEVVRQADMLVDWYKLPSQEWTDKWGLEVPSVKDMAATFREMLGRVVVPKQEPPTGLSDNERKSRELIRGRQYPAGMTEYLVSSQTMAAVADCMGALDRLASSRAIEPPVEVKELVARIDAAIATFDAHGKEMDFRGWMVELKSLVKWVLLPRPGVKASEVGRMWDELWCKDGRTRFGNYNKSKVIALRTAIAGMEDGELPKGSWLDQKCINETLPQFFGLRVYVCDPPTPLKSSAEIAHEAMRHRLIEERHRFPHWVQQLEQYDADYAAALEREKNNA